MLSGGLSRQVSWLISIKAARCMMVQIFSHSSPLLSRIWLPPLILVQVRWTSPVTVLLGSSSASPKYGVQSIQP